MVNVTQGEREAVERKALLIAGLVDVRRRLLAIASALSEEQLDQVFLGTWSARDLLAHLVGWDDTNTTAVRQVLAGELPGFYAHYDKDWATYNSRLVAEYGREDFEALMALLRETHARLLDLLVEIPAGEFWRDRGIRSRGWKVTIGRLLTAEKEDEEAHYQQLKTYAESKASS